VDSGEVVKGLTFTWARDKDDADPSDGKFDLKYWQEHNKTPMF
jgi:hypothetical protein